MFPIETVRVPIETVRVPIETVRVSIETIRGPCRDCHVSHRDCRVPTVTVICSHRDFRLLKETVRICIKTAGFS